MVWVWNRNFLLIWKKCATNGTKTNLVWIMLCARNVQVIEMRKFIICTWVQIVHVKSLMKLKFYPKQLHTFFHLLYTEYFTMYLSHTICVHDVVIYLSECLKTYFIYELLPRHSLFINVYCFSLSSMYLQALRAHAR